MIRTFKKFILDNAMILSPAVFLLLWANGFVFLKLGLEYIEPFTFLSLRYLCVVFILLLLVAYYKPSLPASKQSWKAIIGVGLCLQTGYFACTYLSLHFGLSAGTVALITCQQPLLVALLAPKLASENVSVMRWIGLILGVSGASWVIVVNSVTTNSFYGVLFGLFALISITCSTLIEKRLAHTTPLLSASLIQYSIGLIVSAPLAYSLESMKIEWSWQLIISLIYLVFAASLLAISLLSMMIRRNEASRVSALFFLVPLVTAIMALLFLGEAIVIKSIIGFILTGAGIYVVMRKS